MDQFYLVGYDHHTTKHLALGPYDPASIAEPARGRATITAHLTEDGNYPDTTLNLFHVTGASDPEDAWRKATPDARKARKTYVDAHPHLKGRS